MSWPTHPIPFPTCLSPVCFSRKCLHSRARRSARWQLREPECVAWLGGSPGPGVGVPFCLPRPIPRASQPSSDTVLSLFTQIPYSLQDHLINYRRGEELSCELTFEKSRVLCFTGSQQQVAKVAILTVSTTNCSHRPPAQGRPVHKSRRACPQGTGGALLPWAVRTLVFILSREREDGLRPEAARPARWPREERAARTFLTSWAKSAQSRGGSPSSGRVQESSAEPWPTMRMMPAAG